MESIIVTGQVLLLLLSSPFTFIPLVVVVLSIIALYKSRSKTVRVLLGVFLLAPITFLSMIVWEQFSSDHPIGCDYLFESEANIVAASLANYFAVPTRVELPSINDLVKHEGYILPENREDPSSDGSIDESDLVVTISGDVDGDIFVKVTSKKGRCFKGDAFIKVFSSIDKSKDEWINYQNN